MYVPSHFKEDKLPVLHDVIRRTGLATLVTVGPEGMIASHVPMLLDPEPGPYGCLHGHVAKGNGHWRAISDIDSLAIFFGADAYISPSWYPTKRGDGKVVPTWNYVAVHAYGKLAFFGDSDRLLTLVTRLTENQEKKRAAPWAVSDAPAAYVQSRLKGIVGFELPIARLEGKWKMSQNQPAENRRGVIEGLRSEDTPESVAVAAIMAAKE